MKLEKRSDGEPEVQAQEEEQKNHRKKPVVVYIMILFIVAFVLMAVSFLMHQRSNSEVIGKLQDSVSALQEVQATQDENVQLQEDLQDVQESLEKAQSELEKANEATAAAENKTVAMVALYTLQQQYAAQDYDGCTSTIASMESAGLDKLLPAEVETDSVTSPAQRYLQLKEAVEG